MKGKRIYVPGIFVEELNSIMKEKELSKPGFAIEEMIKYTRIGREIHNTTPIGLISKSLRFPKK